MKKENRVMTSFPPIYALKPYANHVIWIRSAWKFCSIFAKTHPNIIIQNENLFRKVIEHLQTSSRYGLRR